MKSGEFARAEKKFIIERKRKIEKMLPEAMNRCRIPGLGSDGSRMFNDDFLRYQLLTSR